MPADIRNYQSNLSKNFNKNGFTNQTFNLIKLYELSTKRMENDSSAPNFEKGYLPELQYSNPNSIRDIFMHTVSKTFDISGASCVRFILLDRKGKIYDDIEPWTQVLPNSFLARVSCSYRNFDPSSLELDYFIDLTDIQLNNESDYGSDIITVLDKEISAGFVSREGTKIQIDDRISDFNNHKNDVFIDFFKYDFGNAIKNLNLHN